MKALIFIAILTASSIGFAQNTKKMCVADISATSAFYSCDGDDAKILNGINQFYTEDITARISTILNYFINGEGLELKSCLKSQGASNVICIFIEK